MQPSPHAGLLPVPQPPPAAHARAALHLDRQPLPRDARAQNEQDASQSSSVLQGRTTALWTRLRGRKKRGDLLPEIVGEDRFGHPLQRDITRVVRRSYNHAQLFTGCPFYPAAQTSRVAKLRSALTHGIMNAGHHVVFLTARHTRAAPEFFIGQSEVTWSWARTKWQPEVCPSDIAEFIVFNKYLQ